MLVKICPNILGICCNIGYRDHSIACYTAINRCINETNALVAKISFRFYNSLIYQLDQFPYPLIIGIKSLLS